MARLVQLMSKTMRPIVGNIVSSKNVQDLALAIKLAVTSPSNTEVLGCGNVHCYCDGSCVGAGRLGFGDWVSEGIDPQTKQTVGELQMDTDCTLYTEREQEIIEACKKLQEVLIAKNKNYGDSFKRYYDKRGAVSLEMRLEDKMNRLANLIDGDKDLVGEALADTILDIAGYGILGYIEETRSGK